MTATRGIIASLVAVTLIAVGAFFWVQTRSSCPDPYGAAQDYAVDDEVKFAGQAWRAEVAGTSEVPGPNATEWTALGAC